HHHPKLHSFPTRRSSDLSTFTDLPHFFNKICHNIINRNSEKGVTMKYSPYIYVILIILLISTSMDNNPIQAEETNMYEERLSLYKKTERSEERRVGKELKRKKRTTNRRRHTRSKRDWSSDVCSYDLFSYWNLYSIKDVAKMSYGKNKKNENKGRYIIMDMGTVTKNGTMLTHKITPHENDLLKKGDLVM